MKRVTLVGLILLIALLAFSCAPKTGLEISVLETQKGTVITNAGNVDVTVFVTWPDEERLFDLAVGQSRLESMPKPSAISAVTK